MGGAVDRLDYQPGGGVCAHPKRTGVLPLNRLRRKATPTLELPIQFIQEDPLGSDREQVKHRQLTAPTGSIGSTVREGSGQEASPHVGEHTHLPGESLSIAQTSHVVLFFPIYAVSGPTLTKITRAGMRNPPQILPPRKKSRPHVPAEHRRRTGILLDVGTGFRKRRAQTSTHDIPTQGVPRNHSVGTPVPPVGNSLTGVIGTIVLFIPHAKQPHRQRNAFQIIGDDSVDTMKREPRLASSKCSANILAHPLYSLGYEQLTVLREVRGAPVLLLFIRGHVACPISPHVPRTPGREGHPARDRPDVPPGASRRLGLSGPKGHGGHQRHQSQHHGGQPRSGHQESCHCAAESNRHGPRVWCERRPSPLHPVSCGVP